MRKLEVLYVLLAVFLFGCASAPVQQPRKADTHRVAQQVIVYTVDDLVSSGYTHAGTFNLTQIPPFYVLVAEDGFSCIVNEAAYAKSTLGAPTECRWTAPRRAVTHAY